jgi:hypothetical protein
MNFSKVEGHSSLVRDENTKAIINTNTTEYKNYLMMRQSKLNESQKIENLREEIDCVKNDLCEIKKLLQKLSN